MASQNHLTSHYNTTQEKCFSLKLSQYLTAFKYMTAWTALLCCIPFTSSTRHIQCCHWASMLNTYVACCTQLQACKWVKLRLMEQGGGGGGAQRSTWLDRALSHQALERLVPSCLLCDPCILIFNLWSLDIKSWHDGPRRAACLLPTRKLSKLSVHVFLNVPSHLCEGFCYNIVHVRLQYCASTRWYCKSKYVSAYLGLSQIRTRTWKAWSWVTR